MIKQKLPIMASILAVSGIAFFAGVKLSAQAGQTDCPSGKCPSQFSGYAEASPWGRYTISVRKTEKYTSKQLDMERVAYLCGDMDGCQMRLGMHNWDGQRNVASYTGHLFYNKDSGVWRTSVEKAGTIAEQWGLDDDGARADLFQHYSCYVTDSEFNNRADSDSQKGINLLAWDQYNADCWLTLVD